MSKLLSLSTATKRRNCTPPGSTPAIRAACGLTAGLVKQPLNVERATKARSQRGREREAIALAIVRTA